MTTPTDGPHDQPDDSAARFAPDAIAPYDETIRLVLEVDRDPYEPADHWPQVIERLATVTDRPYQAFVHDDALWIQRTPDIEEPLIVTGPPGDRRFCLVTATAEFVPTGTGWDPLD